MNSFTSDNLGKMSTHVSTALAQDPGLYSAHHRITHHVHPTTNKDQHYWKKIGRTNNIFPSFNNKYMFLLFVFPFMNILLIQALSTFCITKQNYLRRISLRLPQELPRKAFFSLNLLYNINVSIIQKKNIYDIWHLAHLWHFSRFSSDHSLSPRFPLFTEI